MIAAHRNAAEIPLAPPPPKATKDRLRALE